MKMILFVKTAEALMSEHPQDTKRCLLLELATYFLTKDDSQFLNQLKLKNFNLNLILTRNIATEQAL